MVRRPHHFVDEGFPSVAGWWRISVRNGFSSTKQLFVTALLASLLLSALGIPVFIVSRAVSAELTGTNSQLNTLRVDIPATSDSSGITSTTLRKFESVPGVTHVVIDLKASLYGAGEEAWAGNVQVLRPWLVPPGIATDRLSGNQVIVPTSLSGISMAGWVGKSMPISFTRGTGPSTGELSEGSVHVVGTYPDDWSGYGQDVVLASEELVLKLHAARYGESVSDVLDRSGVSGAWVQVDTEEHVASVMADIRAQGFVVTSERDRLGALPGLIASFPLLLGAVGVGASLLLSAQILQTVRVGLEQRTREFGLLRMRGYRVADVRRLVMLEVVSSVALGATTGAVMGAGLGLWLTTTLRPQELGAGIDLPTGLAVVLMLALIVGTVASVAVLFALLATQRIMRRDPFLLVMRG